jgi:hypothetical protein
MRQYKAGLRLSPYCPLQLLLPAKLLVKIEHLILAGTSKADSAHSEIALLGHAMGALVVRTALGMNNAGDSLISGDLTLSPC